MAVVISKDTQEITFSESTQDVYISFDDNQHLIDPKYIFELYIWDGDKTSLPATPTITLQANADQASTLYTARFNIDSYLKDFLYSNPHKPTSGVNYSDGVWYYFTCQLVTQTIITGDTVTSATKLGTRGYGLWADNSNAGTTIALSNNIVFGNQSSNLICDPDGRYLTPVYIGDTSTNKSVVTKTQILAIAADFGFTLNSANSSEQIALLPFSASIFGSEWSDSKVIDYFIGSSVTILQGLSFNDGATGQYMDLGIVPMLNSSDSYVKLNFKAFNFGDGNPNYAFGYDNSTVDDLFQLAKRPTDESWNLQRNAGTVVAND